MTKKSKKPEVDVIFWGVDKTWWECRVIDGQCPVCRKRALVPIPLPVLKLQPDDTNIVCHPGLDGCNWGFNGPVKVAPTLRKLGRIQKKEK